MSTHSEIYKVHTYEMDSQCRLAIPALAGFMQEISYNHAEELGFGYSHLRAQHFFWALSRFYLEIDRYPLWGEEFRLTTWHKGYDGVMAMRDYEVRSLDGEILGRGTSDWLVVDIAARRIQRAEQVCGSNHLHAVDAIAGKKLSKLKAAEELAVVGEIFPRFSAIDTNSHVNNVNYFNWAIDYLPLNMMNESIASMEVNFLSEAKLHEEIAISYAEIGEKAWFSSMKNKNSGVEHARVQLKLK